VVADATHQLVPGENTKPDEVVDPVTIGVFAELADVEASDKDVLMAESVVAALEASVAAAEGSGETRSGQKVAAEKWAATAWPNKKSPAKKRAAVKNPADVVEGRARCTIRGRRCAPAWMVQDLGFERP
jgi:hypothetical protein